jgi:hypothetical protein
MAMSMTSPQNSGPQLAGTATQSGPFVSSDPIVTSDMPVVTTTPNPILGVTADSSGVRDYAHRLAFLTEIDSQTWIARYTAAERLGEPVAVSSQTAYAAWLRRTATAWSSLSMPTVAQAEMLWPFTSLAFTALDAAGQLDADLRELAVAGGGTGKVATPRTTTLPLAQDELDSAYLAGATYVMLAAAQEVSVLTADVEHLSQGSGRMPVPQHFVRHCAMVSAQRGAMRRELADWAEQAGPRAADRVVLTARMLAEQLSMSLKAVRPGW